MKKLNLIFCLISLIPTYNLCMEPICKKAKKGNVSILDVLAKDVLKLILEQKALDIIDNGKEINEIQNKLNTIAATCKYFQSIVNPKNEKINEAFKAKKVGLIMDAAIECLCKILGYDDPEAPIILSDI